MFYMLKLCRRYAQTMLKISSSYAIDKFRICPIYAQAHNMCMICPRKHGIPEQGVGLGWSGVGLGCAIELPE